VSSVAGVGDRKRSCGSSRKRKCVARGSPKLPNAMMTVGVCFGPGAVRRDGVLGFHSTPAFRPVRVMGEPMLGPPTASDPARASSKRHNPDCRIEVTLPSGRTIRIGQDVSLAMLRRVLTAMRG